MEKYKDLIRCISEELNISKEEINNDKKILGVMLAAEKWADQLGEFVFNNKESFDNSEDAVDTFYQMCY